MVSTVICSGHWGADTIYVGGSNGHLFTWECHNCTLVFLTRAMLSEIPFGKQDSGTHAKYPGSMG